MNAVERLRLDVIADKNNRQKRLNDVYESLSKILTEQFYDDYDFSDGQNHHKFLALTKRLQHPKVFADYMDVDGNHRHKIVTKNYSHNNEDKSLVLEKCYFDYVQQKLGGSWILKWHRFYDYSRC